MIRKERYEFTDKKNKEDTFNINLYKVSLIDLSKLTINKNCAINKKVIKEEN